MINSNTPPISDRTGLKLKIGIRGSVSWYNDSYENEGYNQEILLTCWFD